MDFVRSRIRAVNAGVVRRQQRGSTAGQARGNGAAAALAREDHSAEPLSLDHHVYRADLHPDHRTVSFACWPADIASHPEH
jgi:hypothetical protein